MKKMKWLVAGAATLLLLPGLARMASEPQGNALKNAKVGQWVEYSTHNQIMGRTMEMKTKQTIVAKDATSVTMRVETTMMGRAMPPQTVKIQLDKTYQPYTEGMTNAKVTKLGEGDESLTVGGKSYPCHWVKVKVSATKPHAMEAVTKVWTCKTVPVTGMVKMESDSTMKMEGHSVPNKLTMVLTGSGG
ncbi:MAG: hypothetical protein P8Z49_01225 [Acidobacteriota bacterium]|jgi:hypothetical protein